MLCGFSGDPVLFLVSVIISNHEISVREAVVIPARDEHHVGSVALGGLW
jgi:hypothetical protein